MLADLNEALRQLLIREVPLNPNEVDVAFDKPDRESVARFNRPTVDLFLFDLLSNKDFTEVGWRASPGPNGRARISWPPLKIDLRYLVTTWASAVEDQHQLLYHVLRTLHRLTEVPDDLREGALANAEGSLGLGVEDESYKDVVDLWGVLDNRLQPGFVLRVTVPFDLNAAYEAPLVRTATYRARQLRQGTETRHRFGGRVLGPDGEPVAGATVRLREESRLVSSDADGRFLVAGRDREAITIEVAAPGFRTATRRVEPPGDYDIRLEAEAGPGDGGGRPPSRGGRRGGGG